MNWVLWIFLIFGDGSPGMWHQLGGYPTLWSCLDGAKVTGEEAVSVAIEDDVPLGFSLICLPSGFDPDPLNPEKRQ